MLLIAATLESNPSLPVEAAGFRSLDEIRAPRRKGYQADSFGGRHLPLAHRGEWCSSSSNGELVLVRCSRKGATILRCQPHIGVDCAVPKRSENPAHQRHRPLQEPPLGHGPLADRPIPRRQLARLTPPRRPLLQRRKGTLRTPRQTAVPATRRSLRPRSAGAELEGRAIVSRVGG